MLLSKYKGSEPICATTSFVMEKHSKLMLPAVKEILGNTSSQMEEIIINDYNFILMGWPDVLSLPRLRTLTVKNRCVYNGLDNAEEGHPFVVTKSPLLRSISIGDSFCNNKVFSIGGTGTVRVWHRMWCSRRAEYWRRSNWRLPLCSRAGSVKWLIHFIMICRTPFSSTDYNQKEQLHKSGESDAFGWVALRESLIIDLPALKTIDLGEDVFHDRKMSERALPYCPFKYNVSLIMKGNLFMPS